MRLAGLDFETANFRRGSICAVGCAVIEDSVVHSSREWLVYPHQGYRWVLPEFTAIHGLSHWDIKDAPTFPEVWVELLPMLLSADCVIIHNAPFDLGHLRSVLELYQLPPVSFYYADSVTITRQRIPGLSSYSLNSVAAHFGIDFKHHNALEDALTCAKIIDRIGVPAAAIKQFCLGNYSENLYKSLWNK